MMALQAHRRPLRPSSLLFALVLSCGLLLVLFLALREEALDSLFQKQGSLCAGGLDKDEHENSCLEAVMVASAGGGCRRLVVRDREVLERLQGMRELMPVTMRRAHQERAMEVLFCCFGFISSVS